MDCDIIFLCFFDCKVNLAYEDDKIKFIFFKKKHEFDFFGDIKFVSTYSLYIRHPDNIGKHSGSRNLSTSSITFDNHGQFPVSLSS